MRIRTALGVRPWKIQFIDSFMPGDHGQGAHNVEMVRNEGTPLLLILEDSLQDIQAGRGECTKDTLLAPTLNLQHHASLRADKGQGL